MEKAESVLLQIKRSLDQQKTKELKDLSQEFYSLLPQKSQQAITTRSMIAKKQNLCQVPYLTLIIVPLIKKHSHIIVIVPMKRGQSRGK